MINCLESFWQTCARGEARCDGRGRELWGDEVLGHEQFKHGWGTFSDWKVYEEGLITHKHHIYTCKLKVMG